jgi:hypothetical protein
VIIEPLTGEITVVKPRTTVEIQQVSCYLSRTFFLFRPKSHQMAGPVKADAAGLSSIPFDIGVTLIVAGGFHRWPALKCQCPPEVTGNRDQS